MKANGHTASHRPAKKKLASRKKVQPLAKKTEQHFATPEFAKTLTAHFHSAKRLALGVS